MKILTISDSPFLDTGFASATRNICQNLPDDIQIYSIGLYDSRQSENIKTYNKRALPWTIFPCGNEKEFIKGKYNDITKIYEKSKYTYILEEVNPDYILIILDIWKADSFMKTYSINTNGQLVDKNVQYPVILYAHIESDPLPIITDTINGKVNWVETLDKAFHIVVNGPFGKRVIEKRLKEKGKNIENKVTIIPNGINLDIFKPIENKNKQILKCKDNDFLIGFFSRMNARKGLPQLFEAFSTWKYNTSSFLYIHSAIDDYAGWDVKTLAKDYGIHNNLIINTDLKVGQGYTDEKLNTLYNACDITVLPSAGESFGRTVCFPPGTLVRSSYGWVPIESMRPGMSVITHKGRHRKVTHTTITPFNGTLKGISNEIGKVFSTESHLFYGRFKDHIDWKLMKNVTNAFISYFPYMRPSDGLIKTLMSKLDSTITIIKGHLQALYIYSETLNY